MSLPLKFLLGLTLKDLHSPGILPYTDSSSTDFDSSALIPSSTPSQVTQAADDRQLHPH